MLNRLENKGDTPDTQIWKLDTVRKLRVRQGIKTLMKMDLNFNGRFVLDSSMLVGATRIIQWVRLWKERRRTGARRNSIMSLKMSSLLQKPAKRESGLTNEIIELQTQDEKDSL